MAVTTTRPYLGLASGTTFIAPNDTESALVTQGLATVATGYPVQSWSPLAGALTQPTLGGNATGTFGGMISDITAEQGPRIQPNGVIVAFATAGTSGVSVAGTWYRCEIQTQALAAWTGIGILNGATAATDNNMVALYDTNGVLITNSAVAGAVATGTNAFQNYAFVNTVLLPPGRYFIACQSNGTTTTIRRWKAADGGNQMTQSAAGVFGTVPASFTPPTTFTDVVGPIGWLYQ